MPTKTIKAPGYPDFKISQPIKPIHEIQNAKTETLKSDQLAEFAHMRLEEVESVLKHGSEPPDQNAIERLDRATSALSSARQNLGEAVYQLEKILQQASDWS